MKAFTSLENLCAFLDLDDSQRQSVIKNNFPLLLPYRLAEKIKKGTLDDPLFRQFIPLSEENKPIGGFSANPVGDREACETGKLLKKYNSRALLITSAACAMNCRFCFRREFPYKTGASFADELLYIKEDSSLKEIILSGGDPLSLSNEALHRLIRSLEEIPHVKRVRFHTRFPIGYPERIDGGFLSLFKSRLQFWFVIHCNHPKELDSDILHALKTIPAPVLCQTVLLKGVNDNFATLKELCELLVDNGILPYYLHQLDRVLGAAHFEVEEEKGLQLMAELQKHLSGYALFRYVKEVAGAPAKVGIA